MHGPQIRPWVDICLFACRLKFFNFFCLIDFIEHWRVQICVLLDFTFSAAAILENMQLLLLIFTYSYSETFASYE